MLKLHLKSMLLIAYIIHTYESSSNSSRSDIEMTSQTSNCYNFRQVWFFTGLLLKFQTDAFISIFISVVKQSNFDSFVWQCTRSHFFNYNYKIPLISSASIIFRQIMWNHLADCELYNLCFWFHTIFIR